MVLYSSRIQDYYLTPEDFEEAEKNGIDYFTAYRRVYHYGWTIEKAITHPKQKKTKVYKGWKYWKDKALVCKSTYVRRINDGWGERKAAMTPPMPFSEAAKLKRKYKEKDLEEAAKNGVSDRLFRYRVKVMGWSIKDAKTKPPMSRSEIGKIGMQRRWNDIGK